MTIHTQTRTNTTHQTEMSTNGTTPQVSGLHVLILTVHLHHLMTAHTSHTWYQLHLRLQMATTMPLITGTAAHLPQMETEILRTITLTPIVILTTQQSKMFTSGITRHQDGLHAPILIAHLHQLLTVLMSHT